MADSHARSPTWDVATVADRLLTIFVAWDFAAGLAALGGSIFVGLKYPASLDAAHEVLLTAAVLGGGVLAVVLAALAVLVTFFDDYYRQILVKTPGGLSGALFPYRSTAAVGGLAASMALASLLVWPVTHETCHAVLLAVSTGLTAWAVVGTYGLVSLTLFHGTQRGELLTAVDEAQRFVDKARRRQAAG